MLLVNFLYGLSLNAWFWPGFIYALPKNIYIVMKHFSCYGYFPNTFCCEIFHAYNRSLKNFSVHLYIFPFLPLFYYICFITCHFCLSISFNSLICFIFSASSSIIATQRDYLHKLILSETILQRYSLILKARELWLHISTFILVTELFALCFWLSLQHVPFPDQSWTVPSAVETQNLNLWTTRKSQNFAFYECYRAFAWRCACPWHQKYYKVWVMLISLFLT